MLEEYIKRLETLIEPNFYSKCNFSNEISRSEFEDPAQEEETLKQNDCLYKLNIEEGNQLSIINNKHKGNTFFDKTKKLTNENKFKIYQKILESDNVNLGISQDADNGDSGLKVMNTCHTNASPSIDFSKEFNHLDEVFLLKQISNLENQVLFYKKELDKSDLTINELKSKIEILEKQNEKNTHYINQLENLLIRQKTNSHDFIQRQNKPLSERNTSQDQEMKEFIKENEHLKAFQNRVYEISKDFDNINKSMTNHIKEIQHILSSDNLSILLSDLEKKNEIRNISFSLCKLLEYLEKTLNIKQSEYNFLLDTKDREIKKFKEELILVKETSQNTERSQFEEAKQSNSYKNKKQDLLQNQRIISPKSAKVNKISNLSSNKSKSYSNSIFEVSINILLIL